MAIFGANGIGPYLINNNYLEGACENLFFGGANSFVDLVYGNGTGNPPTGGRRPVPHHDHS